MIRPAFPDKDLATAAYALALASYWAVVSVVFCLVVARQRRRVFDLPMRELSAAAGRVAGGDFTARLTPAHPRDEWDYVDVMFDDFNTMAAELRSIEAIKDDFIADVSHEIKTPLAVIANYADALRHAEQLTPEQLREHSETIAKATRRLAALVANILKLNKLENGRIAPAPRPFDLARQLSEAAITFADAFDAKNINFTAVLPDQAQVEADEGLLEIVWQNLLANAVKFTPPGGNVELSLTSAPEAVSVTVQDSGCGMTQAVKARIFDKFYQADPSAGGGDGNGLGLALARRAAQMAGASMALRSAPGLGSAFTVVVPRRFGKR
ncbi:MAG: HAMP domain-containing histidine kinase [Propionibacteriaceae bacterium]|jgi:signal transduction histidine kinase|nr:HAMP domain-containing histidine kinase [Propionibacteriaceae bacterium]